MNAVATMPTPATQFGRLLHLTNAPLPDDVLLPVTFAGSETISGLFRYDVEVVAEGIKAHGVDADELLGRMVTLSAALTPDYRNGPRRYFNGVVSRFTRGEKDRRFTQYQMEVVPWLWLLTLTSDCRIFQNLSIPEIVQQIFDEFRLESPELISYRFALGGTYTKLDYCVQYRETDFDFVSRLLEQEGICWYFEHAEDWHTLVLADTCQSHLPCPAQPLARYEPTVGFGERDNAVTAFRVARELRPKRRVLRDYHFETPSKSLEVSRSTANGRSDGDARELFDYPGRYAQRFNKPGERLHHVGDEGSRLAQWRMQETAAAELVARGSSYCWSFLPGYHFELVGGRGLQGPWLLTTVRHEARQSPDYVSNRMQEDGAYNNTFTCIPAAVQYRPPRVTPRPVIHGVQNAVVVGAADKEIDVDHYGRVKVQFPWDRRGDHDQNSSCWIRVAQAWAGKRWGASFWPRVGQEVLVNFIDGDPDNPIVVGSVYNAEQMPPYLGDGPDAEHGHDPNVSGFKTCSTPGGAGFNELRFDDTKDEEQLFMHAQRDLDLRVRHDRRERVGNDFDIAVGWHNDGKHGGHWRELVHGDKDVRVTDNMTEHVGLTSYLTIGNPGEGENDPGTGTFSLLVNGDRLQRVTGDDDYHVEQERRTRVNLIDSLTVGRLVVDVKEHYDLRVAGSHVQSVKDNWCLGVEGDYRLGVSGNVNFTASDVREAMDKQSVHVTGEQHILVDQDHLLEAGKDVHVKAGVNLVLATGGMLTLKGPGGFISIGPEGVTIQGKLVKINCGGAPGAERGADPTEPDVGLSVPAEAAQPIDVDCREPEQPHPADTSRTGYVSAPTL